MNSSPVLVKLTTKILAGAMVLLTVKVALPPSLTLAGATAMETSGTSLSAITPVSDKVEAPPCKPAFMALERVRLITSCAASSIPSSLTATAMDIAVWPAAKVRVPLVAV